jgi:hypothetical protein
VCKQAALTCASKCLAIMVFKKKNQSRSYLNHLVILFVVVPKYFNFTRVLMDKFLKKNCKRQVSPVLNTKTFVIFIKLEWVS